MGEIAVCPPVGVDSVCPAAPYKILMKRADGWVDVGGCGNETLVREHVKSLKRFMPGRAFKVVSNGGLNV